MSTINWDEMDEYYTTQTPKIAGPVIHPDRTLSEDDLDDIFAGRPLAEKPRKQANVLCKTYLTADMDAQVRMQAQKENIGKSALIRKALALYLGSQPQLA